MRDIYDGVLTPAMAVNTFRNIDRLFPTRAVSRAATPLPFDGGVAGGEAILPADWIHEATTPKVLRGGTPLEYGYLWWTGTTPASRRDGAFMAQGIHGQWLYVNPAARAVIGVWSAQPHPTADAVVDDWLLSDAVTDALR